MSPKFERLVNLPKDMISLYPAFYDSGTIYLVDEDSNSDNPPVIRYDISQLAEL